MQLSMTVLRCPDQVAPEARSVSGGEFNVGRGPDVDWVLPDPDRLLSKRHFAVAFRGGAWQVADTSTNGTFLNTEAESIGRGATRSLRDGDRLRLGAYEIEVRLVDQPVQGQEFGGQGLGGYAGDADRGNPFDDRFGDDPMAPPPAARQPFGETAYPDHGMASTSARLPHDFDPLAPDGDEGGFGGGFHGPVQADHSSSMQDAMIAPPIAGYVSPQAGGVIPGDDLLPDDWDKDLLEGIAPPQSPAAAPAPVNRAAFAEAAPPVSQQPVPAALPVVPAALPAENVDFLDPLGSPAPPEEEFPAVRAAVAPPIAAPVVRQRMPRPAAQPATDPFDEPEPGPIVAPVDAPMDVAVSPFDEPSDAVSFPVAKPAEAPKVAPARVDDGGVLAAFFKGAELSGAAPSDPLAMMTSLGQAFRALVSGLRAVLIARATIKSEFRIEQTMIRARGNNPLKFSANDDDALTALLGVGRRTDMTPEAAIEDSLRDLRLHELAVMAAMQVAVRAMLDELSPEKIRAGTDLGGMTVLPAQRKARAWDAFEARHAAVGQALVDDFDSIFGKAFARAYERALDEISTRERSRGERT
jgi:type VI secretion system FHA domain protein